MKAVVAVRITVVANVNIEVDKEGFTITDVKLTDVPVTGMVITNSASVIAQLQETVDEQELINTAALNALRVAVATGERMIARGGLQESVFTTDMKVGQA